MPYTVYILTCADGSYYTGIAQDVEVRLQAHNNSSKGAKYTRSRRPVRLSYVENCPDRSSALKREHTIRTLSKSQKQQLIVEKPVS